MEKDIRDLTKDELLNPSCIPTILASITSENENEILSDLMVVATKYKLKTAVANEIKLWKKDNRVFNNDVARLLEYDEDGYVRQTTNNYELVFNNDERYKNLFGYDTFANKLVKFTDAGYKSWSDSHSRFPEAT